MRDRAENGVIEPPIKVPEPPEHLSEAMRKHWIDTAEKLARMRVMTDADRDALLMYVESYDRWRSASRDLAKSSYLIMSPNGYPIQNPLLAIVNKSQEQCLSILREFGLTPSSRSRVNREK
jgi:P27 family predicted phage terminase small subunit